MDFLADYWTYHSCYEIPRNYALWAGIGLLGAVMHKKVCYYHADLEMTGQMYIGLVGPQGSSKSTCCSFARDFFREACKEMPIGPSRASPESLVKTMAESNFAKAFKNEQDENIEVRPFAFFVNEFKNFVGRSPFDMLTLLTDIYDVKMYDGSSIVRGIEKIVNPSLNLIVCETPEWIVRNIKGDIISGGFGRRIVYCYEIDDVEDKPVPIITQVARDAIDRCRIRLKEMHMSRGYTYKWDPSAFKLYDTWYRDTARLRRSETNPMMKGYLKSKHVQLFKVMMLVDSSRDNPTRRFTASLFDECLFYLDGIETNMHKLSAAAGQNEYLVAQQMVLDILEREGTWLEENVLKIAIQTELDPLQTYTVLKHLQETEQIVKRQILFPGRGERTGFITMKLYLKQQKNGEITVEKVNQRERKDANKDNSGPKEGTVEGDV